MVGPPGCGKSRFVRRLAEEFGSPYELIPCGGMSDGALGGTPRRWSSGEPSLPLSTVRRHECAGPVIILDEVEKVGTGKHNGNAHDVLLGLFEPETAGRWHDLYVQASCDRSHLSWLMTANEVEPIPSVLRDRCRVLKPCRRRQHPRRSISRGCGDRSRGRMPALPCSQICRAVSWLSPLLYVRVPGPSVGRGSR
ncbi:AAA family ATPase [Pseudaminobacter sp. 19-2017]|uniref:AAA family ATPase n=1 Tax=Pseudaminobacter soli (ex Zhang et al. 2022) TaxID=2831468 RepID=A0A942IC39_9HYPH|nr:AAA family ATPase [Pseudaminobacter soli]